MRLLLVKVLIHIIATQAVVCCGWFSSLFFYVRNLGYVVRLSGLRAYVDTCVSVVG